MTGNQISTAMMELIKGEMADTLTFEHQADDTLSQVAVQNTWYDVLSVQVNGRIKAMGISIDTADETLEVRFTIDGTVISGSIAATYGNVYYVHIRTTNTQTELYFDDVEDEKAFLIEGRSIKVEARKTTANDGGGTLTAAVGWDKRAIPTT